MKYIDSIKELLGSGNVSDVLRMAEDEIHGQYQGAAWIWKCIGCTEDG